MEFGQMRCEKVLCVLSKRDAHLLVWDLRLLRLGRDWQCSSWRWGVTPCPPLMGMPCGRWRNSGRFQPLRFGVDFATVWFNPFLLIKWFGISGFCVQHFGIAIDDKCTLSYLIMEQSLGRCFVAKAVAGEGSPRINRSYHRPEALGTVPDYTCHPGIVIDSHFFPSQGSWFWW